MTLRWPLFCALLQVPVGGMWYAPRRGGCMYDVFIGFPGALRGEAQKLRASLSDVGVWAFVDKDDLEPGVAWPQGIEAAMRGATLIVFLLDGAKETSLYVQHELAVALERAKREHTRVIVGWTVESAQAPYGLGAVQAVDVSESMEDLWYAVLRALARLEPEEKVRALAGLLGKHADPGDLHLFLSRRRPKHRFARLTEVWSGLADACC